MMLVAVIIGLVAMFCCILMTAPRKAPRRRRSYRDASGSDDRVSSATIMAAITAETGMMGRPTIPAIQALFRWRRRWRFRW